MRIEATVYENVLFSWKTILRAYDPNLKQFMKDTERSGKVKWKIRAR